MKVTHDVLVRGFSQHADLTKTASHQKTAKRWLDDGDLVKLCRACKKRPTKKS